ncbi:hypothetical protein QN277_003904 [Acacia crassicarpa]|uniref:Uncharacterized protein n=1 Tax=Acacia crassicarpa TaxID=499986 RepID=A0AAE1K0B3_9FABA|nr:hypothetical protein QN277_003904 [Acacia crassicarpa]
MKEIYQMKQQHAHAAKTLNLICENVKSLNENTKSMIEDALFAAAKTDKVEFLLEVTKANPEILLTGSFELFFDAVRHRRTTIFNLLRGFSFKHLVTSIETDDNEIKLLHLTASLAPSSYLNQISVAALQMQRKLQWFKATESMVDIAVMNLQNKMNLLKSQKQPLDHFKDNHRKLRKEGGDG